MIRLRGSAAHMWGRGFMPRPTGAPVAFGAHVLATAAVMLAGGSATALACPVCFGAQETSLIDGAKLGVLVMVAVTLAVQGAFVGFFLYLRTRAKRIAEADLENEWSQLQGASRTS
jgi:hypothetical protein